MLNLSVVWVLLVIVMGVLVSPFMTGFIFFTAVTTIALGNIFNYMGRDFKKFMENNSDS